MQSVGVERNEYRRLLLWLVQYGTTGKCPSFCCKDFFATFSILGSCLSLNSTQHVSPLYVLAITCDKPGSAEAWITIRARHWLIHCKRIRCCVCSAKNKVKKKRTKFKCRERNIGLCVIPCFEVYHTKLHFWGPTNTKMEKRNTQISVNFTILITDLIYFSSVLLMNQWGCGFYSKGCIKEQRLVGRSFVCIYFTSPIWGKIRAIAWRHL